MLSDTNIPFGVSEMLSPLHLYRSGCNLLIAARISVTFSFPKCCSISRRLIPSDVLSPSIMVSSKMSVSESVSVVRHIYAVVV